MKLQGCKGKNMNLGTKNNPAKINSQKDLDDVCVKFQEILKRGKQPQKKELSKRIDLHIDLRKIFPTLGRKK